MKEARGVINLGNRAPLCDSAQIHADAERKALPPNALESL